MCIAEGFKISGKRTGENTKAYFVVFSLTLEIGTVSSLFYFYFYFFDEDELEKYLKKGEREEK